MTGASDSDPLGLPKPRTAGSAVRVASVGQIGGLRPRRRPGDGGDVDGADIDLVDGLGLISRRTVAAWLHEAPSHGARRFRLRTLASFLRWLRAGHPGLALLDATGVHVRQYCDAALAGRLPQSPGRSLARATVSRRHAALTSLYHFAWEAGSIRAGHDDHTRAAPAPTTSGTVTLTRDERRSLRLGVAKLAAEGHTAEAAAVALLDATGAPAEAVAGVTRQDLRVVADGHGGQHVVIVLHPGHDDAAAFVLPPLTCRLLRALCGERAATEPIFGRNGGPGAGWFRAALARVALAGGIPEQRAAQLVPRMLRTAP
ncbi:hypothetical protein [Nonomuraea sp. NPDC050691]|uniref:hypothetical protein n=1 Tax=Nonomuraea sp. NPDC050691 TaxID=3155661 RepID=UPI0034017033